jgi:hypothetical protein
LDVVQVGWPEQDVFVELGNGDGVVRVEKEAAKDPASLAKMVYAAAVPVPRDPYKVGPNPLGPFAKGPALGFTLGQWLAATAKGTYTVEGGQADVTVEAQRLVPNGVYSVWCSRATLRPNFALADAPCGAADGSQNTFRADAAGNGAFRVKTHALPVSTQETLTVILLAYHSDGKTHGGTPGSFGHETHVQLFTIVPGIYGELPRSWVGVAALLGLVGLLGVLGLLVARAPIPPPQPVGADADGPVRECDVVDGSSAIPAWFVPVSIAIVVVGLGLRLVFALAVADPGIAADWRFYRNVADNLADGNGYSIGRLGERDGILNHPPQPFADFPPMFAFVLAGLDIVGCRSPEAQRVALSIFSAAGLLLMALLGRRLGGPSVGAAAAAIAAIHPLWIQPAGIGMSESIFLAIVPAVLLLALGLLDHPTGWRAFYLGVAVGVATLTRSESIALVVVLATPTLLLAIVSWRARLVLGAALLAGCVLMVGPWVARNYAEFGGFALSTQQGGAFSGTNCANTYAGPGIGGFDTGCYGGSIIAAYMGPLKSETHHRNPLHLSWELQRVGFAYIRANSARLPVVVAARVLRGWSLFAAANQVQYDVVAEGRHRGFQRAGQYLHWVLLPLAVVGAALLPRRCWRRWSILLAGPILFTIVSAGVYGSVRLRTIAEPSIALFAAAALVLLDARFVRGVRTRR